MEYEWSELFSHQWYYRLLLHLLHPAAACCRVLKARHDKGDGLLLSLGHSFISVETLFILQLAIGFLKS